MKAWGFLFAAILTEVIATSALKQSEGFTRLVPSVVVVVGYGLAFYLLSLTLAHIPVGVAYAVWAGLGVALITLAGWLFFGQALNAAGIVGIVLIVSGVAVLQLFGGVPAE